MKKLIFIFLIAISTQHSKAQTGVQDTLNYLESIVANKSQFVGQPFAKLMDSLKISIRFYYPFASLHYDKNKETSTSFAFYFPQTAEDTYLTSPQLEIYWQSVPDAEQSRILRKQYRAVGWNQQIFMHYSSHIISDIKVLD